MKKKVTTRKNSLTKIGDDGKICKKVSTRSPIRSEIKSSSSSLMVYWVLVNYIQSEKSIVCSLKRLLIVFILPWRFLAMMFSHRPFVLCPWAFTVSS